MHRYGGNYEIETPSGGVYPARRMRSSSRSPARRPLDDYDCIPPLPPPTFSHDMDYAGRWDNGTLSLGDLHSPYFDPTFDPLPPAPYWEPTTPYSGTRHSSLGSGTFGYGGVAGGGGGYNSSGYNTPTGYNTPSGYGTPYRDSGSGYNTPTMYRSSYNGYDTTPGYNGYYNDAYGGGTSEYSQETSEFSAERQQYLMQLREDIDREINFLQATSPSPWLPEASTPKRQRARPLAQNRLREIQTAALTGSPIYDPQTSNLKYRYSKSYHMNTNNNNNNNTQQTQNSNPPGTAAIAPPPPPPPPHNPPTTTGNTTNYYSNPNAYQGQTGLTSTSNFLSPGLTGALTSSNANPYHSSSSFSTNNYYDSSGGFGLPTPYTTPTHTPVGSRSTTPTPGVRTAYC